MPADPGSRTRLDHLRRAEIKSTITPAGSSGGRNGLGGLGCCDVAGWSGVDLG